MTLTCSFSLALHRPHNLWPRLSEATIDHDGRAKEEYFAPVSWAPFGRAAAQRSHGPVRVSRVVSRSEETRHIYLGQSVWFLCCLMYPIGHQGFRIEHDRNVPSSNCPVEGGILQLMFRRKRQVPSFTPQPGESVPLVPDLTSPGPALFVIGWSRGFTYIAGNPLLPKRKPCAPHTQQRPGFPKNKLIYIQLQ